MLTTTATRRLLGGAVALALLAGACSSDGDDGGSPPASPATSTPTSEAIQVDEQAAPPTVSAVPISDEQVRAAIASLDDLAEEALARTGVPGMAIAVVHDDDIVYAKGFGVRDTTTDEPVDADTVFQIASLSKPVGATVVARLVGEGTVGWDDRIIDHLPNFALSDPLVTQQVTLADLYSHRSGLPDHAGDLLEDLGYDQAEIFDRLRLLPLEPFRASYAYTNFGLTAAAEAAADAAGTPWAELSEELLYRPLGMTSTSSRFADFEAAPNRALTHVEVDGAWVPLQVRDPDAQSPAGGVSSTANDMARWLRLWLAEGAYDGRQLVDPDALAELSTPHALSGPPATPDARSSFYGLGIGVGNDWTGRVRLSHSGAFALGAATTISLLPAEDLAIVVLTNGSPVGLPESVAGTFMDLVEVGRPERDWLAAFQPRFEAMAANPSRLAGEEPPQLAAPARADAAYLGTYANDYYGPLEVVTGADGGLVMALGPGPEELPLTHWDGDVFSYEPTGENAMGISAVTFTVGPDGRATQVVVEALDALGLGTFTRT